MKKTVFISYDFRDKSFKGEIEKWLVSSGVNVISTDENDLRPIGDNAIESAIKNQMESSNIVFVLVGNNTHNRPWVDYEVAVAGSIQKPIYWIRLTNRYGAPPPEVRNLKGIGFNKIEVVKLIKGIK